MKYYFIARLVCMIVNANYNSQKWAETNSEHYHNETNYFETVASDTFGIMCDLFGRETATAWRKEAREIAENTAYKDAFKMLDNWRGA